MARNLVKVKFQGNWKKLQNSMVRLSEQTGVTMRQTIDDSAEDLHQTILDAIMNQNFPFAPLAKATIEKKGHDKVFFETGQVFEGLTVHTLEDDDLYYKVFVGAPHNVMHKNPEGDIKPLSDLVAMVEDEGSRYERLLFKTAVERRNESFVWRADKAMRKLL